MRLSGLMQELKTKQVNNKKQDLIVSFKLISSQGKHGTQVAKNTGLSY